MFHYRDKIKSIKHVSYLQFWIVTKTTLYSDETGVWNQRWSPYLVTEGMIKGCFAAYEYRTPLQARWQSSVVCWGIISGGNV
jgi:hypothetical protein